MTKNKPKHLILIIFFRFFSFFIYLLPLNIGLKIGKYLGRSFFYILGRQRKIALANLYFAFGRTKSLKEKHVTARGVFENLGKSFVEVISLSKFNKNNIDKYVTCKNLEIVGRLIREGKGGIVLSAHLGNWELLAHYFAIKGFSVNVIARRLRMELFEKFLQRVRARNGVKVLYRDASAKDVIGLIKKNEFVGIMPDQDMESVSGVFVDFFGRPSYTPNGPAVLNRLTGAPIVPCFITRKGFGHEVLIEEPIEMTLSQDKDRDILKNTQRYTKIIENYVRNFPAQWVWFHERWKTKSEKVNA